MSSSVVAVIDRDAYTAVVWWVDLGHRPAGMSRMCGAWVIDEPHCPSTPDWQALLVSALKAQPTFRRSEEGADHDKIFTVTITAKGRSVSSSGRSVKAARKNARRNTSFDISRTCFLNPRPRRRCAARSPTRPACPHMSEQLAGQQTHSGLGTSG